jgi:DNA primase
VAALGTAATASHFETLFRYCPEVLCCFDGDKAGRGAAWRALNHAIALQREGRQVRFLFLPEGEDPDSLVQKEGKAAFEQRLSEQSLSLSDYLFRELEQQCDMTSMDGKARLASLAQPIIAKASDPIFKTLLTQAMEDRIGLRRPAAAPAPEPAHPRRAAPAPRALAMTPMRTVMALLLQEPTLVDALDAGLADELTALPGGDILKTLCDTLRRQPGISTGGLLALFSGHPAENSLHQLAAWEYQGAPEHRQTDFRAMLDKLKREANLAVLDPETLQARIQSGLATAAEKARFAAQLKALLAGKPA